MYIGLKLNFPRRGKRRLPERICESLVIPMRANDTWSADFMTDALWSGRRFRTFNVNDDFNRESLKIEIDTFRTEVLDCYVFTTLGEVRRMTEDWRHRYNHHRPHRSLGGLTPIHYAMAQSPSTSTCE